MSVLERVRRAERYDVELSDDVFDAMFHSNKNVWDL